MWNGVDDDGNAVPAGMYYTHVEIDGVLTDESDLFLLYLDPLEFLTAPNAVTDANGRFRIPDSLVPVGEVIEATNELGEVTNSSSVSDTLRILAVIDGEPDPLWTQVTVVYEQGAENSGVDLQLQ